MLDKNGDHYIMEIIIKCSGIMLYNNYINYQDFGWVLCLEYL